MSSKVVMNEVQDTTFKNERNKKITRKKSLLSTGYTKAYDYKRI